MDKKSKEDFSCLYQLNIAINKESKTVFFFFFLHSSKTETIKKWKCEYSQLKKKRKKKKEKKKRKEKRNFCQAISIQGRLWLIAKTFF